MVQKRQTSRAIAAASQLLEIGDVQCILREARIVDVAIVQP